MRATADNATIVVFMFQFSLLGTESWQGNQKLDPFGEPATSRSGDGTASHLDDGMFRRTPDESRRGVPVAIFGRRARPL
jgi:hypothetical protein